MDIGLSQSGLIVSETGFTVPSLRSECCRTVAEGVFRKDSKLPPLEQLYALPKSALPMLIDALRDMRWEKGEQVNTDIGKYALEELHPAAHDTTAAMRFVDIRKPGKSKSKPLEKDDKELSMEYDIPLLDVHLRRFALSEYLTLASGVESFDSVVLSVVGTHELAIPMPTQLVGLKTLVLRRGCYNISGMLLKAAHSDLRNVVLEGDNCFRKDSGLAMLEGSNLRRLLFRDMDADEEDGPAIQRALQKLTLATELRELAFENCGSLPLASLTGYLLKRMPQLTSFSVSALSLPASVCGSISNAEQLTHVSLRGSKSINESHLAAIALATRHVEHLDLAKTSVDSKKLHWLAREVAKMDGVKLTTLDLGSLLLTLSPILAMMKSCSLRKLVLQDTNVVMKLEEAKELKEKAKKKAKDKRIGGGKKGGGGAKQTKKPKKKENDSIDAGVFETTITHLFLNRFTGSNWCAAQIVAHCPLLEYLDASGTAGLDWDDDENEKKQARLVRAICEPENEFGFSYKDCDPFTAAVLTRHSLKYVNFLFCQDDCTIQTPSFKGLKKAGAFSWPALEWCFLPNPTNYLIGVPTNYEHLTTVCLSTGSAVPIMERLPALKHVTMYAMNFDSDVPEFQVKHVGHAETLLFYKCTFQDEPLMRLLGLTSRRRGEDPPDPDLTELQSLAESESGLNLKRIYFSTCQMYHQPGSSEDKLFEKLFISEKRLEILDRDLELYNEELDPSDPRVNRPVFIFSSRALFKIRVAAPWFKYSLVTTQTQLVELLGGSPSGGLHPDRERSLDGNLIWELGAEAAVRNVFHTSQQHWEVNWWV